MRFSGYDSFRKILDRESSGDGGGVTPVPIPNTEVKSSSVDGTWRVAAWESRTLLVRLNKMKVQS